MKKALVLSLVVVLGLGVASFAQTLSGTWDTTITITPAPAITLGIHSELIVTYAVSGWAFSSDTVLTDTGWSSQSFKVNGTLGAFTLGSVLDFDPLAVAFKQWEVTGGLSLAGVTFSGDFVLIPNVTTLDLIGSGTAGTVTVKGDLKLGSGVGCNFDFNGVTIDVGFPFCCANVTSEINITCAGFQYVKFDVVGIAIPNLPWVTIGADVYFTTQTKTLTLTPEFNFGTITCFNLYISEAKSGGVSPSPLVLGDFSISGIGLDCTIGGVEFIGVSYFGTGTKPSILKNHTSWWEAYQIKTTDDGCCGPFEFDITVGFMQGGLQLFDVAGVIANMSLQVAQQFTFTTGISIDLSVPAAFTQWTIGFKVTW